MATDSQEIEDVCRSFGAHVIRTGHAESGTERIAQIIKHIRSDTVVNVQADEPEINPKHIDKAVEALESTPQAAISTLATPLKDWKRILNPSQVKVVLDHQKFALFFSRSPIPICMDEDETMKPPNAYLGHVGLYAYRKEAISAYAKLKTPPAASLERLEQLKFLHYGAKIAVRTVMDAAKGVDTTIDYREFVARKSKRRKLKKL